MHTKQGQTAKADERVHPVAVARAIRFMHGHLTAQLRLHEIAAAVGVPERTLRRQFRQFTGQSPLAFHRNLRLDAAHRALRLMGAGIDVATIAEQHGFGHFGQFAAYYRERFHELPSETRRAALDTAAPQRHITRNALVLAVHPFQHGPLTAEEALAGVLRDATLSALGRMRGIDAIEIVVPQNSRHDATYAVRGRVTTYGSRVQVSIRLIEAATGRHVWGNAYDAALADLPSLQLRVVDAVTGGMLSRLRDAETRRIERTPPGDRSVQDSVSQAFHYASTLSHRGVTRAFEQLDRALSLNPDDPMAVAISAWCHAQLAIYNFSSSLQDRRDEARRRAAVAVSLDDADPMVLAIVGTASSMIGDLELAEIAIGKSLSVDPGCAMAWQRRGWLATYRGEGTALADFSRGLALDPNDPGRHNIFHGISTAHFLAGRYDRAADWAMLGVRERPSAIWAYRIAAAAQARCGRLIEAKNSVRTLLQHYPNLTVGTVVASLPMQSEFLARYAEGLESAGAPS